MNVVQDRRVWIIMRHEALGQPQFVLGAPVKLPQGKGGDRTNAAADMPAAAPYGAASGAFSAPSSSSSSSSAYAPPQGPVVRTQAAGGGYGGAATAFTPISALNPYSNRWSIKVRVTTKGDVRSWSNAKGTGRMFKTELLDEAGSEIGAAFFKDAVDKFDSLIVAGGVYVMSGGKVKVADPKFSRHQYEITFDEKSTISACNDDKVISSVQYNFRQLATLSEAAVGSSVDVIGVLSEVKDAATINTKAGKEMQKREIVIMDSSGDSGATTIEVTLWDAKAALPLAQGQVVAVKGAKVSEWNTRSLSTMGSSSIAVGPDLPEAHALLGWFQSTNNGANVQATTLSERGSRGGGGGGAATAAADSDLTLRYTVDKLRGGEGGAGLVDLGLDGAALVLVKAGIKYIRTEPARLAYPACRGIRDGRQCSKKLDNSNGWACNQGCAQDGGPEYRYMLSTALLDATGDNFVTIFNAEAEQLLGMKAEPLMRLGGFSDALAGGGAGVEEGSGENPDYLRKFQELLFNQYLFTVKVKVDSYKDEQKLTASVVKVRPLKGEVLLAECRALVANIKKYLI
jgi:replication factor A1